MSETPRADAFRNQVEMGMETDDVFAFVKKLECELAAVTKERDDLARAVETLAKHNRSVAQSRDDHACNFRNAAAQCAIFKALHKSVLERLDALTTERDELSAHLDRAVSELTAAMLLRETLAAALRQCRDALEAAKETVAIFASLRGSDAHEEGSRHVVASLREAIAAANAALK